ncbi:CBS domain-containing protein [Halobacteria archaeon AArc-m2/3/4]|uniref:CBS domain-containing protein n=1 Tax=Natronoglomus mannanivorans TaxID=2979990 RepID=A0AAP2YVX8_9EURY|nr:CBS domain-containing protein [Halobacteria archaeon AArc-xg1-1]MCU4971542.1 CBS domain-containing protein [Halobacteria archaeon AArc-m2/3/4]
MESELLVRDVLTKEYVGVSESDTVLGAVELMREERIGCVLAVRGTEPVGIMTEWDVLGLVVDEGDPGSTTVEDVMSTPVLTIEADRPLPDAATQMARENNRNMVVTDGGELLGVLTQRDIIAAAGSFQGATAGRPGAEPIVQETVTEGSENETLANGGDEYTTQGVCEACGSLADSLRETNGRLVCPDCRSV